MDPNELLNQIRGWAKWSISIHPDTTQSDGAKLFQELDNWLSKGGFPPDAWSAWITDTQRKFKDQAKLAE